jgi:chromosomal replication initiation ATPase DnaA
MGWSLDDIGKVINKDHATVLHYKKIMCNLVETNDVLVENLENISFRYGIIKEDFIKYKRHSR